MANAYVVALDVGTSSVRAILFDQQARAVPGVEAHLPYQPRVAPDGTCEVDSERLWRLVLTAVDEVLNQAGAGRRSRIAAVGVSTFWHGLVAADGRGKPLTPLYLWADSRAWREADELRRRLPGGEYHDRTGCVFHPSYWPAKMLWLRRQRPELAERADLRYLSFWDVAHARLFGEPATSLSMASGTGLMEVRKNRWDAGLLKALQVSPDQLPPLAIAGQGLSGRYASRWPALADVPWLCAAGDGALANLGTGCKDPSARAITIGTSGALRVLYDGFPAVIPEGLWAYRLDARRTVVGGALSNGGNLYAWLTANLQVDTRTLEKALAGMPPASTGLVFLPLLAGERSPGWASHATGAIAGLTHATTPLEIVRAGLEAIAIEFRRVDERLDQALPAPRRLVASGAALVASPAWIQIVADVLGRPVAAARIGEASSRGAAILALEHIGAVPAGGPAAALGADVRPVAAHTRRYEEEAWRQEALYEALVGDRLLDKVNLSTPHAAAGGDR